MASAPPDPHQADHAELLAVKAFRPNVQPVVIAMIANVVLAAMCLGVPYYRGHVQAQASLQAFARFAGCLLNAEPGKTLGLGMPQGEEDHFAAQVMIAGKDWPARCRPLLQAIAPEEAIFLWPSVKTAGSDLRALVQLGTRELDALGRQRLAEHAGGRVPARPLLVLERLRAGLTLFARAAGADDAIDSDAVRFTRAPGLVPPARLPLMAGGSAALQVWAGQDGLRALAMDARGVSWLQVEDGKLDRHRLRRTSLVRAALRAEDRPLLVWAMSQQRCAEQADHCVRRATGVALVGDDDYVLPTPEWLGGQPAGRADRSLRLGLGGRVDLLARKTVDGELEVRRFTLENAQLAAKPEPAEPAAQPAPAAEPNAASATPPHAPGERIELPIDVAPSDALLLPALPAAVAYTMTDVDGEHAWFWPYDPAGTPIELGVASGSGPWLSACETEGARYLAFGTRDHLALARVAADGAASLPLPETALNIGAPIDGEDAAHDRVRIACSPDRVQLFIASADAKLLTLRCEHVAHAGDAHNGEQAASACSEPHELARDVSSFDVVQRGEQSLLAYARVTHPEITVLRLDANGRPLSLPIVPAACWDPTAGMCGKPTLVNDSGRLLLCARDGADLLAIESNDGGEHWLPMSGLKVENAISTDVSAPMNQHRLRKGLE